MGLTTGHSWIFTQPWYDLLVMDFHLTAPFVIALSNIYYDCIYICYIYWNLHSLEPCQMIDQWSMCVFLVFHSKIMWGHICIIAVRHSAWSNGDGLHWWWWRWIDGTLIHLLWWWWIDGTPIHWWWWWWIDGTLVHRWWWWWIISTLVHWNHYEEDQDDREWIFVEHNIDPNVDEWQWLFNFKVWYWWPNWWISWCGS